MKGGLVSLSLLTERGIFRPDGGWLLIGQIEVMSGKLEAFDLGYLGIFTIIILEQKRCQKTAMIRCKTLGFVLKFL